MTDRLPDAFSGLRTALQELPECSSLDGFLYTAADRLTDPNHGDFPRWRQALDSMPTVTPAARLNQPEVALGLPLAEQEQIKAALQALVPWRKGPWRIGGVAVDSEWRSDWKWQRIEPHLDLQDRRVLDVGCGNGYYAYRMLGKGARWVVGVDPGVLFVMQFLASRKAAPELPVWVLPLGVEDLPADLTGFDTVFSMGVLYHRRDHHEHLRRLHNLLRSGGQLVLETLVLDAEDDTVLVPEGRYANMRNVHAVPSVARAQQWLADAGFSEIRRVDMTATSTVEQRTTEWMPYWSLDRALDPDDPTTTVEGHPAPLRAVWIAERDT